MILFHSEGPEVFGMVFEDYLYAVCLYLTLSVCFVFQSFYGPKISGSQILMRQMFLDPSTRNIE